MLPVINPKSLIAKFDILIHYKKHKMYVKIKTKGLDAFFCPFLVWIWALQVMLVAQYAHGLRARAKSNFLCVQILSYEWCKMERVVMTQEFGPLAPIFEVFQAAPFYTIHILPYYNLLNVMMMLPVAVLLLAQ